MSSNFLTLSIHGADLAAIESLCPDYAVRSISQGWITVVSDNLEWGTTQKEAKRLSKVLPHHILSTEYFDDESKILYMSSCYRVTSFDLENRQIRAIRDITDDEDYILCGVLSGIGPVILTGDSSIQVWDSELTPVSRHRAKGFISKIVHQDGKTYVLSGAKEERILRKTENGLESVIVKPGVLRLYELQQLFS